MVLWNCIDKDGFEWRRIYTDTANLEQSCKVGKLFLEASTAFKKMIPFTVFLEPSSFFQRTQYRSATLPFLSS